MKPIAIFYHCLLFKGNPPEFSQVAFDIVKEQLNSLKISGLMSAAKQIVVGVNGGKESEEILSWLVPKKAKLVFHGLESKAENLTLVEIEKWAPSHPGWNVLYIHSKGATHDGNELEYRSIWRRCLMKHLVKRWRNCVSDLEQFESVGCHYMCPPATPPTQYIWAGNFWWARSDFLATVPSIYLRQRIKDSGIAAPESRFEAEVWLMNGKVPSHKDYHGPFWDTTKVQTCQ